MMQMSPELEALARADDVTISDKNSRKRQFIGMGLFSLAGIAMATVMLASGRRTSSKATKSSRQRAFARPHFCATKRRRRKSRLRKS
jgi:hypothetical protein